MTPLPPVALPPVFLGVPLAHRGLHDLSAGRPENSRAAFRAAVSAGYGIELDVQRSVDDVAMVFHDPDLPRLTGQPGPVHARSARDLGAIRLTGGDEGIPTLAEVLNLVAGQVPLLIEVKDQDGALGPGIGPLERAVSETLRGYGGPYALMSFNPHAVARLGELRPEAPRGLITCGFDPADWQVPAETLERLRAIPDHDRVGASFVSHDWRDLDRPRVAELKAQGSAILTWTIRSLESEAEARRIADNITFEGYAAALP